MLVEMSKGTPEIMSNLDDFTVELNAAVGQINSLLAQRNVQRVSDILENLDTAVGDFTTVVEGLGEIRREVSVLVAKTDALLDEDSGELGEAIVDLNHALAAVARHVDSIAVNLDTTTRNMSEFSERIRDNPGVLILGREEGEEP
jgi:ABC-type transporter Mla subunit MlaD